MAFKTAALMAFRDAYDTASPAIMERVCAALAVAVGCEAQ